MSCSSTSRTSSSAGWSGASRDARFPTPGTTSGDGRWHVAPDETLDKLLAELAVRAGRSRAIIERHDLGETGKPGDRWDGEPPATLERILFHLVQEYARHLGHLDIVTELAGGATGE